ncbi:MAG: hypothetical protein JNJ77_08950 [Planctomycetia bacterium]|nr:hypothetical protein [Planctomycetia bacterium]
MDNATTRSDEAFGMRVLYLLDAVKHFPEISEELLEHGLIDGGKVSREEAKLAIRLVPIALGYLMLKELGLKDFPTSFLVMNQQGELVSYATAQIPHFRLANQIAAAAAHSQFTKFASLAALHNLSDRSPAMQGLYSYLRAGNDISTVKELRLEPPMLMGISAEEVEQFLLDAEDQLKEE